MPLNLKMLNINKSLWIIVLLTIPLMSVFGRNIQQYVIENYSRQNITITIGVILALMCIKGSYWLIKNHAYSRLWHLLWFIPLFIIYPYTMPIIEERVHFIIFGLLGYLSSTLFPVRITFLICISISVLDEGLQWYLPDRVGDWHDISINLIASIAGAVFSYISVKKQK